jgi:hypothetical protein
LTLLIPSFNTATLASLNGALPDDGESVHQMVQNFDNIKLIGTTVSKRIGQTTLLQILIYVETILC